MSKKGKKTLFCPDPIATAVRSAIDLDLCRGATDGTLTQWQEHFRDSQSKACLKKYASEARDQTELRRLCLDNFVAVNSHLARVRERLQFPHIRNINSGTSLEDAVLLRARALVARVLGPFDTGRWFAATKHSSGTSLGVPFVDTSIERKFALPISGSASAVALFREYLRYDSDLAECLDAQYERLQAKRLVPSAEHRFERAELAELLQKSPVNWTRVETLGESLALRHLEMLETHGTTRRFKLEESSRATTVLKNDEIDRFINVEPTLDMYFQQGLATMMTDRLRSFGLDIRTLPDRHKQLACIASITGSNATIDLKDASSCLLFELVEWLTPPDWFCAMNSVTQRKTRIEDGLGNIVAEHTLNMFSTMGNAVTFPVETLVFWALGLACHETLNGGHYSWYTAERPSADVVSVFGDDCILPTATAPTFIKVCEHVGFIVNETKSFYDDSGFRESCGGDYLHGMPVRPFYLKAPTSNAGSALEPWLYVIANRVLKKYVQYFGTLTYIYDKEFFRLWTSLVEKESIKVKVVPDHYPDDSGLKISSDLLRFANSYKVRFAPVSRSKQGLYRFQFCKYQYADEKRRDDSLRYHDWLKTRQDWDVSHLDLLEKEDPRYEPAVYRGFHKLRSLFPVPEREPSPHYSVKRLGGYVVAVALESGWTLPKLDA